MLYSTHCKTFEKTFEQEIYQVDRKWTVAPSAAFTAKFEEFFILTQENALC